MNAYAVNGEQIDVNSVGAGVLGTAGLTGEVTVFDATNEPD